MRAATPTRIGVARQRASVDFVASHRADDHSKDYRVLAPLETRVNDF
jgi:hypothetical protein